MTNAMFAKLCETIGESRRSELNYVENLLAESKRERLTVPSASADNLLSVSGTIVCFLVLSIISFPSIHWITGRHRPKIRVPKRVMVENGKCDVVSAKGNRQTAVRFEQLQIT